MLRQALEGIKTELNTYLLAALANGSTEPVVKLLNIANVDSNGQAVTDNVIMSLVNIEEETTLKNGSMYRQQSITAIERVNPTLFLNFYVLFAINSTTETNYLNALLLLSNVLSFFQQNRVISKDNAPTLDPKIEKLIIELYSPNFEQLNHLWAMLGGKYMPSVLYKVRLLMIEDATSELSSLITSVEIDSKRL
ncbi:DUF4255 domain-containing protein [Spirosoma sp. BT702]|uniref:DUF4255 domain-containing protein n=1 Tax=Spirosoma profusum TaxID=2771354 RepID=A0A926XUX1_9BACT|nr:DUF4255 domain-containing protein [Spirosoma profusum]MBD2700747.1 DUF4255 domain-containing protein [Spirosoma profusum]